MPSMRVLLVVALGAIASAPVLIAQERWSYVDEQKLKWAVVDTAGIETEVTKLLPLSADGRQRFDDYRDCVIVQTEHLHYAIPLPNVDAVKANGGRDAAFTIEYRWLGKSKKLVGKIDGKILGTSDLGSFTLEAKKLKSLTLKSAPLGKTREESAFEAATKKGTLSLVHLADKTKVSAADLKGYYTYYSTEGFVIGGTTLHRHDAPGFTITRGESDTYVSSDKLKKVEFDEKGQFTITTVGGMTATGQKQSYIGYSGIDENGPFYIPRESVKAIDFAGPK